MALSSTVTRIGLVPRCCLESTDTAFRDCLNASLGTTAVALLPDGISLSTSGYLPTTCWR